MSIEQLLSICQAKHIELWKEAGQLRYKAPIGAVDEDLLAQIKQQKSLLLALLTPPKLTINPLQLYEPFPLSAIQAAYLLGRNSAFEYGGNACHIYLEYQLANTTDLITLEKAWNKVVQRHPMLRAVIEDNNQQRILKNTPYQKLTFHHLTKHRAIEIQQHLSTVRARLDHACIDLAKWPILQPEFSITNELILLHLSVDFTLVDYASLQLLLFEWMQFYDNPNYPMLPLHLSFRDYICYEQEIVQSIDYYKDKVWWLARLVDFPARPDLPIISQHQQAISRKFDHYHYDLSSKQWEFLSQTAKTLGVSPTSVVLSAFAEIIGRWSQTSHFCLNLTVFNRPAIHSEINHIVGDFTSLTMLAIKSDSATSFIERTKIISQQIFEDLDHRNFSGIEVLRELAKQRGRGNDLMPIVFTSGIGSVTQLLEKNINILPKPSYMISQTPQVWLDCQVTDQYGGLQITWDIRQGIFPEGMANAMFEAYYLLLNQLADNAAIWHTTDDILFPERTIIHYHSIAPHPNISSGIIQQAIKTPQATVIIDSKASYSYQYILQMAMTVSEQLTQLGITSGDRVAIILPKSAEQLMAVLGILQLGAVYVPIASNQPSNRQEIILASSQAKALITQDTSNYANSIATIKIQDIKASEQWPPQINTSIKASDLAYIIYTSGSTGTPKGVMLSHGAVANTLEDINNRYQINAQDKLLGLAELSFDLSVYDFLGFTARGGSVVLPNPNRINDPSHWVELMQNHSISIWNSVPAQAQLLIDYLEAYPTVKPSSPRIVMWSGDWIPPSLPKRWWALFPTSKIYSLGGATEAAIWSIEHPIDFNDTKLASIPYGKALTSQSVEVLNQALYPCPIGVRGEIYIAGVGLAEGYANDPQQTANRFITQKNGRRLYKTGDLGRYLADGSIEFLGREDDQVKIRGYRIELAEIDNAINQNPAVNHATTIILGEKNNRYLHSFATLKNLDIDETAISNELTELVENLPNTLTKYNWPAVAQLQLAIHCLAQACLSGIFKALAQTDLTTGKVISFSKLCEQLHLPSERHALLLHWLTLLTEQGSYLIQNDDQWQLNPNVTIPNFEQSWQEFAKVASPKIWPQELTDYFKTSANLLLEQLQGYIKPNELMFPQGSNHIAQAMYTKGLHAQALHQTMAEAIAKIIQKQPTRNWRILEIGAGTAAATRHIVTALAALTAEGVNIHYLFSDVSQYFLNSAKEYFSDYKWMDFIPFDMNGALLEQGIATQSIDIIISSGALNNAHNTPNLLDELRQLSSPQAWWIIQELTQEHPEISISQSLMMEQADDSRQLNHHLFIHRNEWLTLLNKIKGDFASAIMLDTPLQLLGYEIFINHVKTNIPLVSQQTLMDFIKQQLPYYMVPSFLQLLDKFPITANGKIDKKTLTQLAKHPNVSQPTINSSQTSYSSLTARLIKLWETILNYQPISPEQDFFELGGDSLLITQLIVKLRETEPLAQLHPFDLLLRIVLSNSTPNATAKWLEDHEIVLPANEEISITKSKAKRSETSNQLLTQLNHYNNEFSLIKLNNKIGITRILVHEGLGTLQAYKMLIPELTAQEAVAGLVVQNTEDYLAIPAQYLNTTLGYRYAKLLLNNGITQVNILGYCSGGLIAIELAKSLVQMGGQVDNLDIVSSYRIPYLIEDELLILINYAVTLGLSLEKLQLPSLEIISQLFSQLVSTQPCNIGYNQLYQLLIEQHLITEQLDQIKQRILNSAAHIEEITSGATLREETIRLYEFFKHSVQASFWGGLTPYIGALRLFIPEQTNPLIINHQQTLKDYWQHRTLGDFSVDIIKGNHFNCLNHHFVKNWLRIKQ